MWVRLPKRSASQPVQRRKGAKGTSKQSTMSSAALAALVFIFTHIFEEKMWVFLLLCPYFFLLTFSKKKCEYFFDFVRFFFRSGTSFRKTAWQNSTKFGTTVKYGPGHCVSYFELAPPTVAQWAGLTNYSSSIPFIRPQVTLKWCNFKHLSRNLPFLVLNWKRSPWWV
jgi:hypothetical protein